MVVKYVYVTFYVAFFILFSLSSFWLPYMPQSHRFVKWSENKFLDYVLIMRSAIINKLLRKVLLILWNWKQFRQINVILRFWMLGMFCLYLILINAIYCDYTGLLWTRNRLQLVNMKWNTTVGNPNLSLHIL